MMTDAEAMAEALKLAERGRGWVEPNPLVGAVVLDASGAIVGRGFHERFGQAHAEVNALAEAGSRAAGGTMFVTLEPCCHHGKTPPCTNAIIAAGIRRVVTALEDPFPQVRGQGIATLQAHGVHVEVGLCQTAAKRLNGPYLKLLQTGMPWVHLKWAMSLDGRIATRSGESQWITNDESRAEVHRLRGRMDAILVGRGTVVADDPLLTARPPGPRVAARVIVTFSGNLPRDCRLRQTARDVPVLIYTAAENVPRLDGWVAAGAEVIALTGPDAMPPDAILRDLGRRRYTNVLIEGGPGLLGRFMDAKAVDEVHAFIAAKIIGGEAAPGPIGGLGIDRLSRAISLTDVNIHAFDTDRYIHGYVEPS